MKEFIDEFIGGGKLKILFFLEDYVLSRNAIGGASALAYSHHELLSGLGFELILLVFRRTHDSNRFSPLGLERDESSGSSIIYLEHILEKHNSGYGIIQLIKDREAFSHMILSAKNIYQMEQILKEVNPDIIWAEHLGPALLASRTAGQIPVIYSHHDWLWKIKRLRKNEKKGIVGAIKNFILRIVEYQLVKRSHCVTGSISDFSVMRKIGAKSVGYFPTTYQNLLISLPDSPKELKQPKIVHLGGMNATANRLGLERFMEIVWPKLITLFGCKPELLIIGDMEKASKKLVDYLLDAGATCLGYVENLETVLHPFDIHIIPWEFDTGTRTRLPLIFNYAQVLVATSKSVACYEEVEHNKNCLLVDALTDMPEVIFELWNDETARYRIGINAKNTFQNHFTSQSQESRMMNFLSYIRESKCPKNQEY